MSEFKYIIPTFLIILGGSGTGNAEKLFYCNDKNGNRLVYDEGDYAIIILRDSVGVGKYQPVDTLFWLDSGATVTKGTYCK